jgi:hypothetical protein
MSAGSLGCCGKTRKKVKLEVGMVKGLDFGSSLLCVDKSRSFDRITSRRQRLWLGTQD